MSVAAGPPPPGQPPLPHFAVRVAPPALDPWLEGNTGLRGFTSYTAAAAGPHVAIVALVHGNEIGGAIALDRLLRAGIAPARGRLTLGFANLGAFARFDPAAPTASRFVDEDLNRLWDPDLLDGPRRSAELDRARAMRPLIESVDVLLDLHSMLWPSEPLLLCGRTAKGRQLAEATGAPPLVVADAGHASGPRLIDYARFGETGAGRAVLVEAGQHWEPATVETTLAAIAGLLRNTRQVASHPALPPPPRREAGAASHGAPRFASVTQAVTATTGGFAFVQPYRGGDVVPRRNTLIAMDGNTEIRTPHDDCLLVMPSLRPSRGHTAVRLARFAP